MTPCNETCTVDCGRCKGKPLADLHRRIRRALAWGRDAHGGIPFGQKWAWQQGYAEARRRVLVELGTGVAGTARLSDDAHPAPRPIPQPATGTSRQLSRVPNRVPVPPHEVEVEVEMEKEVEVNPPTDRVRAAA